MALEQALKPRKVPTQERALATFDALIEATARVLIEDGYEATSTNRIAARAGVSVGSLYQYFPGKDALVMAVIQRHSQSMLDVFSQTVMEVEGGAGFGGRGGDDSCSCAGALCRTRSSTHHHRASVSSGYDPHHTH